MNLLEMTKEERSLLLFFESVAVEYGGKIDTRHMNMNDREIASKWNNNKFIQFGRMKAKDIQESISAKTHWVKLSEDAWKLAHEERKARFKRLEYQK